MEGVSACEVKEVKEAIYIRIQKSWYGEWNEREAADAQPQKSSRRKQTTAGRGWDPFVFLSHIIEITNLPLFKKKIIILLRK